MRDGSTPALRPALLLPLALAGLVLALVWAWTTPPAPNSDRYDYVGRAANAIDGHGLSAPLVYPLRMAFPPNDTFPPPNLTRPPVWPALLVPGVRAGLGDRAGVLMAGILALPLLWFLRRMGDVGFGPGAGGVAALAVIASFTTWRGIWGGGPEIAVALLTFLAWTWTPAMHGAGGYLACGSVYGILPLLHPVGWLYAGLAFAARSHRYGPAGRWLVLATALAVAGPWYLRGMVLSGIPLLQTQAELARSIQDPGGMGPYLGLDPVSGLEVLRSDPGAVVRTILRRAWDRTLHLDAWLAWPLVLAALWGARRDPRLAARDAVVLATGGLAVAAVSAESRLLLPLLPVAAIWSGAGMVDLAGRIPRFPWWGVAVVAATSPWWLPGPSFRPGEELDGMPREVRDPGAGSVVAVGTAGEPGTPMFTDSAVLAWRSRRPAVFLPSDPAVLDRLRRFPVLARADVVVLGAGRTSRWARSAAWDERLAAAEILEADTPWIGRLREGSTAEQAAIPVQSVGRGTPLPADYVPAPLVEIPVPPANREGLLLRPEALRALEQMLEAAAAEGIGLRVISAYRSHAYQTRLHRQAVERHGPDQKWVARPGESEHQLGTTVDLADAALAHVLEQSFGTTPEGQWVARRGPQFGFVVTYTDSSVADTGILPEPWHVRYLGVPLPDEAP